MGYGWSCWLCKGGIVVLTAAIVLATGGAGIPALGAAVGTYLGVSAAAGTAAVAGVAGMTLGAAMNWICCKIGVFACCTEK